MLIIVMLLAMMGLTGGSQISLEFAQIIHNSPDHLLFHSPTEVIINCGHHSASLSLTQDGLSVTAPSFALVRRDADRHYIDALAAEPDSWRYDVEHGEFALILFSTMAPIYDGNQLESILDFDPALDLRLNRERLQQLGLIVYAVYISATISHVAPRFAFLPPRLNTIQGLYEVTPTMMLSEGSFKGIIKDSQLSISTPLISTIMAFHGSHLLYAGLSFAPSTTIIDLTTDLLLVIINTCSSEIIGVVTKLFHETTAISPFDIVKCLLEQYKTTGTVLQIQATTKHR